MTTMFFFINKLSLFAKIRLESQGLPDWINNSQTCNGLNTEFSVLEKVEKKTNSFTSVDLKDASLTLLV